VPHRPLVFVSGLTLGDYLLWNWSLNSNHALLALVSGLTLPPLAVACLWLLALTLARLIGHATRRSLDRAELGRRRTPGARRGRRRRAVSSAEATPGARPAAGASTAAAQAGESADKIAA
jgi:hypothetical protein